MNTARSVGRPARTHNPRELMLSFTTAEALAAEPDLRRYLHVLLLTAIRDKAERLELRFTEDGAIPYYRIDGRDWELIPPPDEIADGLAEVVRQASRLVSPERPDVVVTAGVGEARYSPTEVGWLTYQLGGYWVDLIVTVDPRRPWGGVVFELTPNADMGKAAGDALAGLAEHLAETHTEADLDLEDA